MFVINGKLTFYALLIFIVVKSFNFLKSYLKQFVFRVWRSLIAFIIKIPEVKRFALFIAN